MDAVEVAAKIKWEGKGIPKKENFLLAVLTNTINTIHKWSGCKTQIVCVIISEKKMECERRSQSDCVHEQVAKADCECPLYL